MHWGRGTLILRLSGVGDRWETPHSPGRRDAPGGDSFSLLFAKSFWVSLSSDEGVKRSPPGAAGKELLGRPWKVGIG